MIVLILRNTELIRRRKCLFLDQKEAYSISYFILRTYKKNASELQVE